MGNAAKGKDHPPEERARPVVQRSNSFNGNSSPITPQDAYQLRIEHRIRRRAEEISQHGSGDVNIFITGAPMSGCDKFCESLADLCGIGARYAQLHRLAKASQRSDIYEPSISRLDAARHQALSELADAYGDIGVSSRPSSRSGSRVGNIEEQHPGNRARKTLPLSTELVQGDSTAHSRLYSAGLLYHLSGLTRANYLLYLEQEYTSSQRQQQPQQPPIRIFFGNVLDTSTVAIQASELAPCLNNMGKMALELSADLLWQRYTSMFPSSNTLMVYIHYPTEVYNTSFDEHRAVRNIGERESAVCGKLEPFWNAHKRASDKLYLEGSIDGVTESYFVLVITCQSPQLNSTVHRQFIADKILETVQWLQDSPQKVWGRGSTTEARREFLSSAEWRSDRLKTVPLRLVDNNTPVSSPAPGRRGSLDLSSSSSGSRTSSSASVGKKGFDP